MYTVKQPTHYHTCRDKPPCVLSSVRKLVLSHPVTMNSSHAPFLIGSVHQKNRGDFPASLSKLRQRIEDKVHIVHSDITEDQQGVVFAEDTGGGLWKFAVLTKELNFHLQQLQTETEHEINNIQTQQLHIEGRLQQLTSESFVLREKKKQIQREFTSNPTLHTSTLQLRACRALQVSIAEGLVQSERLVFQKEALSTLRNLLTQDLHRYQEETQRLACFTQRILKHRPEEETSAKSPSGHSMQEKTETNNMEPESESNKQTDSLSEEEPSTPRVVPPSPKYQLFLDNDLKTNGLSGKDADGPGGGGSPGENSPRLSRWETTQPGLNNFQGSLESLASRDLETDRTIYAESPRVFNSPYTTLNINTSADYNPTYRTKEFKSGISTSELNLHTLNSHSSSPLSMRGSALLPPRMRYTAYDSLLKRRNEVPNPVISTHYSMRAATLGGLSRKDFIEELTLQLDNCQKRNQFLEAESVEMEKERTQIRFEMRGLLVNSEDLLRTNTQLSNELKRMREQMIEMQRTNQALEEKNREMEIEVKQARDMMLEANTQEYAFGFLQQSLKNKIQDAEDSLEKEALHSQNLAEKLWLAERQMEELEVDKDSKSKKASELRDTVIRLETELADALQMSSQSSAEFNLQQKLRQDAQLRMEELEESLLEKEQELQKHQALIIRLQGDVSGKLIDKAQTLEEEIQLRERLQLQCKQAERTVDDLQMELQTTIQAKEDLAKQLKQAQEKMIDLESDVEELHDSEQRWAAKHKRNIEQTEQLQMKLIQEKDLNDQLETEKAITERQYRDLRLEMDELQSSKPLEDVISKTESRVKELENLLRTEERSKAVLSNTIGKLERRINELSDQIEEEHRLAAEQKDLMAQRIRSLKRQLNEAEEEASRRDAQLRHTQRELAEERESNGRLQRQLLDQHLQTKRKDTLTIRQTLDNLRLDLSVDDEDELVPQKIEEKVPEQISKVTEV
ncbi:myosin-10 isoform X5 [Phyllopteryx taeniolatus]|uniref:myosin-10 isoform X5 n=1 Tax=Phyllopteryx taeniolatus TaxID=161469 RepID=UPI002AD3511A|nr:myosin-10 isoform X5 [Phyllopteryx taeniolatus]